MTRHPQEANTRTSRYKTGAQHGGQNLKPPPAGLHCLSRVLGKPMHWGPTGTLVTEHPGVTGYPGDMRTHCRSKGRR
jgi:hypothetical protein